VLDDKVFMENDEELANRLGKDAKSMDWDSFSSSVSSDISIVKSDINSIREEIRVRDKLFQKDIDQVIRTSASYENWLIGLACMILGFFLSEILKHRKSRPK
jgi:hypothetical protein